MPFFEKYCTFILFVGTVCCVLCSLVLCCKSHLLYLPCCFKTFLPQAENHRSARGCVLEFSFVHWTMAKGGRPKKRSLKIGRRKYNLSLVVKALYFLTTCLKKSKISYFETSRKPGQRPERHSCCLPLLQEKKQYKYFGLMHIFHQIAEISSNWSKTMNSVITAVTEAQSISIAYVPQYAN